MTSPPERRADSQAEAFLNQGAEKQMTTLKIVKGYNAGQSYELTAPQTILGRHPSCDIVLSVRMVSRQHARILRQPDGYYLEDLRSSNGSYVNRQRITGRQLLRHQDRIQIHDVVMTFCDETGDDDAVEPAVRREFSPRYTADDDGVLETRISRLGAADSFSDRPSTIVEALEMWMPSDSRIQVNPAAKLRAVVEMTRNLGNSLAVDDLLPRILESVFKIFPQTDRGYILLAEGDDCLVPYAIKLRWSDRGESLTLGPISRTLARQVMEGKAILSSDASTDDRFEASLSVHDSGMRSMMSAPLMGPARRPLGIIHLDTQDPLQVFSKDDLDVLVSAATLAGQAVEYAQLHQARLDERRQAEERLRMVIDTARDAFVAVDERGLITDWNQQAEATFGWPRADVLGQSLAATIIPPKHRDAFARGLEHFLETGEAPVLHKRLELTALRRNGREFPVELTVWPSSIDSGVDCPTHDRKLRFNAFARDITELKQAQARVLQSERLAAIGEMVAGLAHESRNALQRSQACLEILSLKLADRPDVTDLIERVQTAQDDLHHLYERVREYAAPLVLNRKPSDLGLHLKTVWENLTSLRDGRDVELHSDPGDIDLRCEVDGFRIEQVFRNLLENALSACADPVRIEVAWSKRRINGRAALQFAVRDNGPGMTAEQRERIFEPFYTTKTHGTGLGMAIVKRIVEAHAGHITVATVARPWASSSVPRPGAGGEGDRAVASPRSGERGYGAEMIVTLPRKSP